MEFLVLGPLSVIRDGVNLAPTAPKQRQLLALFLVNANRPVSMSQVVTELWEYVPPPSAVAAVHTYVMQLRKALHHPASDKEALATPLTTLEQGYRLDVRTGELDLHAFTDRTAVARMSLVDGDHEAAARQLRVALGMWRGKVLADVTAGPLLQDAIDLAERRYLEAVTWRVEAELHLGRHHELVGELRALVHRYPCDETLAGHLMLALYRSGRQADALAAFNALRHALTSEYRLSPADELLQLYLDILSGHPRLESPTAASSLLSLDLVHRL
jgi:DNA-binding SARP family transcriptional activator